MTLWRDLIHIPTQIHKGDFVLKLAEGLQDPAKTIGQYVVTEELAVSFDETLRIVAQSVNDGQSRATYLHGSFGSGKSHFMAVLDLLISGDKDARAIPRLAPVVTKYKDTLNGKKLLMVPYHMVGANDMESQILGGYVEHVKRLYPEAPTPGVYPFDKLLANADDLRRTMGDEAFFQRLRGDSAGAGKWGTFGKGWDPDRYDRARKAEPASEERSRLVSRLVDTLLPAVKDVVGQGEAFVSLDEGLSIVSQHAKSLGYDGIILFLDELILWLASHAGDIGFLNREGPKLSKLVEAQHANRPAPIISFVARQRDIRDFVGDTATGQEFKQLEDSIQWWEGRFDKVTLEDRNLPVIVNERLLKPRDNGAKQTIGTGFESTVKRLRNDELDVVLGKDSDRGMFEKVFPFSPALMHTLIALSAFLQRDRTALRLMSMLLSRHRDTLAMGEIVPIGDLWDVIAEGEEPFSDAVKGQFAAARHLYERKLRPMLLGEQTVTEPLLSADPSTWKDQQAVRIRRFRSDDRIVKTLLLAKLVPGVAALENMTARRLHALNWGSVKTPFSGGEAAALIRKVRQWATHVSELRIQGNTANPHISIELSEVDLDAVLGHYAHLDNEGNRRRLVRDVLFAELGLKESGDLFRGFSIDFKGARRTIRIAYANTRTMSDQQLTSQGDEWSLVIDYPFDAEGHSPQDDLQRLQKYREANPAGTRTLVWLPGFLSSDGIRLLGKLIIVNETVKRFEEVSVSLSPLQRPMVKAQLEAMQHQLEQRVNETLLAAYGLSNESLDTLDTTHDVDHHIGSLTPGFNPHNPGSASFHDAVAEVARAALSHQFPAAYALDDKPLTKGRINKILDALTLGIEHPDRRAYIDDKAVRKLLLGTAQPLRLCTMGDTHVVPSDHWHMELDKLAQRVKGPLTVGAIRERLDPADKRTGLASDLQDLIILVYALQANRGFERAKTQLEGAIGALAEDTVLVEQALPSEADWKAAKDHAASVFGVTLQGPLNVRNAAKLARLVDDELGPLKRAVLDLTEALSAGAQRVGLSEAALVGGNRHQTAECSAKLARSIRGDAKSRLESLARAPLTTSPTAVGTSIKTAQAVIDALQRAKWQAVDHFVSQGQAATPDAKKNLADFRTWFTSDHYVQDLSVFTALENESLRILSDPPPPNDTDWRDTVRTEADLDRVVGRMREGLAKGQTIDVTGRGGTP